MKIVTTIIIYLTIYFSNSIALGQSTSSLNAERPVFKVSFGNTPNGGVCSKSDTILILQASPDNNQNSYAIAKVEMYLDEKVYHTPGAILSEEMSNRLINSASGSEVHFVLTLYAQAMAAVKIAASFTIK